MVFNEMACGEMAFSEVEFCEPVRHRGFAWKQYKIVMQEQNEVSSQN